MISTWSCISAKKVLGQVEEWSDKVGRLSQISIATSIIS
jgi:hypothetical protein